MAEENIVKGLGNVVYPEGIKNGIAEKAVVYELAKVRTGLFKTRKVVHVWEYEREKYGGLVTTFDYKNGEFIEENKFGLLFDKSNGLHIFVQDDMKKQYVYSKGYMGVKN